MVRRYCAGCGREVERLVEGLCSECYINRYGIAEIPKTLNLVYCKYCGSYKSQGVWSEGAGSLEDTVKYYTSLHLTRRLKPSRGLEEAWIGDVGIDGQLRSPHGNVALRVRLVGVTGGLSLEEERLVTLTLRPGVCPSCTARITKRGYEAEVQIRSSEGRMSGDLKARVGEALLSLDAIIRESIIDYKETKYGVDLLVRDHAAARIIAGKLRSRFMARVLETSKVVGRNRDGSVKRRYTISVRIPDIRQGEVIDVGGERFLVLSLSRSGVVALNLSRGGEETLSPEKLWSRGFSKYRGGPEMRRYMLMSIARDYFVFLDADSGYQEVVEASKSRVRVMVDDFREGDEYLVYHSAGRIYVLSRANV